MAPRSPSKFPTGTRAELASSTATPGAWRARRVIVIDPPSFVKAMFKSEPRLLRFLLEDGCWVRPVDESDAQAEYFRHGELRFVS